MLISYMYVNYVDCETAVARTNCSSTSTRSMQAAYFVMFIKEIKNAPSALLSYISTREFLRTREK